MYFVKLNNPHLITVVQIDENKIVHKINIFDKIYLFYSFGRKFYLQKILNLFKFILILNPRLLIHLPILLILAVVLR